MPTKIGLRVYQMTVHRVRNPKPIPFGTSDMQVPLPDFVKSFVRENVRTRDASPEETERDRRWYFEPHRGNTPNNNRGLVRYGILGFESDFIDSRNNKREFRRETIHVEIIPLFFEFWHPSGFDHMFAVFQSFAARSCVELVSSKMQADFASRNPGFFLRFRKLLPTGEGGIYDAAPVKGLRLIKRNASADIADRYLNASLGQAVNFQVVINARRKEDFGTLSYLTSSMKAASGGVIQHDGVVFEEAIAEIDFGGARRRVGMFGASSEAGVIDLADVKRAADGHPVFASISKESTMLLTDFQKVIGKPDQP